MRCARLNRRAAPHQGKMPLRRGDGFLGTVWERSARQKCQPTTPWCLQRLRPASPQSPQPTESAGHRPQQRPAATLPLCFRATRRSTPESRKATLTTRATQKYKTKAPKRVKIVKETNKNKEEKTFCAARRHIDAGCEVCSKNCAHESCILSRRTRKLSEN